jgi:Holliday junction DNA helicase RuvA
VLSGIEPADLVRAIRQSDVARLVRIPGVGKKTGERLVVELKDRLPQTTVTEPEMPVADGDDVRADLLSALGNLGYQRAAVEKAVDNVMRQARTAEFEPLLREILKALAR